MAWRMPAETEPHERIWMAFPKPGLTFGDDNAALEAGYQAWTAVAHAVLAFTPVTMAVDPSQHERARRMLSSEIELLVAPLDDFWMRDIGPTFVVDDVTGELGAVDWIFNGWGSSTPQAWSNDREIGRTIAAAASTIRSGVTRNAASRGGAKGTGTRGPRPPARPSYRRC